MENCVADFKWKPVLGDAHRYRTTRLPVDKRKAKISPACFQVQFLIFIHGLLPKSMARCCKQNMLILQHQPA